MNILSKMASFVKSRQKDLFLVFCITLISFISFNLGRINALQKTPISIKESSNKAEIFDAINSKSGTVNSQTQQSKLDTRVVASKNSDKYHFTWCSGAKRIKEENKIWFENEASAQTAGYTKAGNCN